MTDSTTNISLRLLIIILRLGCGVFGFWARDRFWGRVVEVYMMQTIDEVSSNFVCYFLVLRVVPPDVSLETTYVATCARSCKLHLKFPSLEFKDVMF